MDKEILVWQTDTWGTCGQHRNLYTFIIEVNPDDSITEKSIFEYDLNFRHDNQDSSRNKHRYTFTTEGELSKLKNKILKKVEDYKSSRNRIITISYYKIKEDGICEQLESKQSLRDRDGFYDIVKYNNKDIIIRHIKR